MLYFLDHKELADCAVRVPAGAAAAEQEVPCHKLALCAASGFFFRSFIAGAGAGAVVALPALPEDQELRRQVDVSQLFPVVLRYIYSNQAWASIDSLVTSENAMGLFALGELLEIPTLSARAFQFLDEAVLSPTSAAQLLYAAVQLRRVAGGSAGAGFETSCQRCVEVLRQGFGQACAAPSRGRQLLSKLPVDVLAPILEAPDLNVPSEGIVLEVVQRFLRARLAREEAGLDFADLRLTEAPAIIPQLIGSPGGVVWEVFIVEQPLSPPLDPPETAKYSAASPVAVPTQQPAGVCTLGHQLSLRYPVGAVGAAGCAGCAVLRVVGASGEVLCAGLLPVERLAQLTSGGEFAEELTCRVRSPADEQATGVVRFRWRRPAEAAAVEPPAEGVEAAAEAVTAEEGGAGPAAEATVRADQLSEEDAKRILDCVRFPHLEHKELLAAMRDPVLVQVGAQQRVMEALSSRLSQYEHAPEAGALSAQEARPSTMAASARGPSAPLAAAATLRPTPPATAGAAEASAGPERQQAWAAQAPASPEQQPREAPEPSPREHLAGSAHAAMRGGLRATARGGLQRPLSSGGGSAGHPLFPCGSCGQGQLLLRQGDTAQWCAKCSRCPHNVWLPGCVTAAAVDGFCAACTVRLGSEVRTLTVRVGREHGAALLRLPGGVDTLRGMCVAGCSDALLRLGE
ncbi:unnamed protein product [Prorocentrum cordatum]|uniref:BTB domain-containing protein n=1 Tax=Prorocentrum cordatum TaxID=2364126 RepID=A0ABN9Q656_9DINO|nr:unnamed protein product [Polarella glacialis]